MPDPTPELTAAEDKLADQIIDCTIAEIRRKAFEQAAEMAMRLSRDASYGSLGPYRTACNDFIAGCRALAKEQADGE